MESKPNYHFLSPPSIWLCLDCSCGSNRMQGWGWNRLEKGKKIREVIKDRAWKWALSQKKVFRLGGHVPLSLPFRCLDQTLPDMQSTSHPNIIQFNRKKLWIKNVPDMQSTSHPFHPKALAGTRPWPHRLHHCVRVVLQNLHFVNWIDFNRSEF